MERILSMIGLAKKADMAAVGEEPVGAAARARHARVILTAQDAGDSTVRRAASFARQGACLCLSIPADKETLGRALGRTSCAMVAITDIGFAGAIVKKLAVLDPKRYGGAAERLEIKARRAEERREEKRRHEKNLHSGKKKKREEPLPPEEKKAGEKRTEPRPGVRRRRAGGHRPAKAEEPRFAHSRPVKKGKGSVRKK